MKRHLPIFGLTNTVTRKIKSTLGKKTHFVDGRYFPKYREIKVLKMFTSTQKCLIYHLPALTIFFKKKNMSDCWSGPWGHQWALPVPNQPHPWPPQPLPMDSRAPFHLGHGLILILPGLPGWTHGDGYPTYDSLARCYYICIFLVVDASTRYKA